MWEWLNSPVSPEMEAFSQTWDPYLYGFVVVLIAVAGSFFVYELGSFRSYSYFKTKELEKLAENAPRFTVLRHLIPFWYVIYIVATCSCSCETNSSTFCYI